MSEQLLGVIIGALATIAAGAVSVLVKTWVIARRKRSASSSPHPPAYRSPFGIKITSPGQGAIIAGTVEVSGTYATEPRGALWLLNVERDRSMFWPQVGQRIERNRTRKTWRGTSWVGGDALIVAATAGPEAERLFRYYEKVGRATNQWPGIEDFPADLMAHDEVWVQHKKE
ncbi:MAG: hypothetical protein Q7O66_00070 [Dehalococcoidia bacterium]|nr:hypothetical protein [Dehalococcoidia bacterium]